MPDALTALAPAKINLVLEVLGRRQDGYHEIDTVLQTVALADRVTIRDASALEGSVVVMGPFREGVPDDDANLAWKAAAHLAASLGRDPAGLRIEIEKQIPPAGGLGGGSSDAATTLWLLAQWWPEATDDDLLRAAVSVGSDEAFFLVGGTARARGRGEHVTKLPPLPEHGVVLFIPPETIERKTARLFDALGKAPFDDGSRARTFSDCPPSVLTTPELFNAFERVAFDVFPGLRQLRDTIEARIGDRVRLSGAGPSMFWIGPTLRAEAVAKAAAGVSCRVILTRTVDQPWR